MSSRLLIRATAAAALSFAPPAFVQAPFAQREEPAKRPRPEGPDAVAGAEAALQVFEGQSHAQFYRDDHIPAVKEAFDEVAGFFDKHLGR